ncbi:MAG: hypothetical protein C0599_10080 [Salinivirgaceae bacterium]|nr:MAG: hypothetical protein C0599_10080 [Salinivirgaceae bacterium]
MMKVKMLLFILAISISNIAVCQSSKVKLTEKQKIEALIKSVEELENAKFYRNGSLYDAKTAAKHLRMKLNNAGNRVKTTIDFIDKIASKSSMSGNSYKIVFADGHEVKTRDYFLKRLRELEQ